MLNYVLQALVSKSVNMVKQLYYSEIHSKNIEIYLSKLYTGKYSEVNDVIKYTPLTNGGRVINYITWFKWLFCDVIS